MPSTWCDSALLYSPQKSFNLLNVSLGSKAELLTTNALGEAPGRLVRALLALSSASMDDLLSAFSVPRVGKSVYIGNSCS
jgi:hypothetical protein